MKSSTKILLLGSVFISLGSTNAQAGRWKDMFEWAIPERWIKGRAVKANDEVKEKEWRNHYKTTKNLKHITESDLIKEFITKQYNQEKNVEEAVPSIIRQWVINHENAQDQRELLKHRFYSPREIYEKITEKKYRPQNPVSGPMRDTLKDDQQEAVASSTPQRSERNDGENDIGKGKEKLYPKKNPKKTKTEDADLKLASSFQDGSKSNQTKEKEKENTPLSQSSMTKKDKRSSLSYKSVLTLHRKKRENLSTLELSIDEISSDSLRDSGSNLDLSWNEDHFAWVPDPDLNPRSASKGLMPIAYYITNIRKRNEQAKIEANQRHEDIVKALREKPEGKGEVEKAANQKKEKEKTDPKAEKQKAKILKLTAQNEEWEARLKALDKEFATLDASEEKDCDNERIYMSLAEAGALEAEIAKWKVLADTKPQNWDEQDKGKNIRLAAEVEGLEMEAERVKAKAEAKRRKRDEKDTAKDIKLQAETEGLEMEGEILLAQANVMMSTNDLEIKTKYSILEETSDEEMMSEVDVTSEEEVLSESLIVPYVYQDWFMGKSK